MRKHTKNIIAIIYFVATFLTASHIHHEQKAQHLDCKICTISHNLSVADTPNILSSLITLSPLAPPKQYNFQYISIETPKGYNSNAPPQIF